MAPGFVQDRGSQSFVSRWNMSCFFPAEWTISDKAPHLKWKRNSPTSNVFRYTFKPPPLARKRFENRHGHRFLPDSGQTPMFVRPSQSGTYSHAPRTTHLRSLHKRPRVRTKFRISYPENNSPAFAKSFWPLILKPASEHPILLRLPGRKLRSEERTLSR